VSGSLNSIEAEQALLGAVMFSNDGFDLVPHVRVEHFSEPIYGALFGKAREMVQAGRNVDPVLLASAMVTDGRLAEIGGLAHLVDLVGCAPPVYLAPDYAREIIDRALRRELINQARQLQDMAVNDHQRCAQDIAAEAERSLEGAQEAACHAHRLSSGSDAIQAALSHAERFGDAPEYPAGLTQLDRMLGGFQRGELTILAGRPGMGKSIVGLCVARTVAMSNRGAIYFSLEMSDHSLGLRLACDTSFKRSGSGRSSWGPIMSTVSKGRADLEELGAVREAQRLIASKPLRLDTRPGVTVSQIEQTARKQFREWRGQGIEPGPVFVDHLGLVRPERDRRGSKYAETADVSRGLAELAKRLNVPVIALCQLNRGVEGRDDKRPQLSDLRQAGELEEDARMVILLHRPAYYLRSGPEDESFEKRMDREAEAARLAHVLNLIVAKNSNGPVGEIKAFVDVTRSAVRDWEV